MAQNQTDWSTLIDWEIRYHTKQHHWSCSYIKMMFVVCTAVVVFLHSFALVVWNPYFPSLWKDLSSLTKNKFFRATKMSIALKWCKVVDETNIVALISLRVHHMNELIALKTKLPFIQHRKPRTVANSTFWQHTYTKHKSDNIRLRLKRRFF